MIGMKKLWLFEELAARVYQTMDSTRILFKNLGVGFCTFFIPKFSEAWQLLQLTSVFYITEPRDEGIFQV